MHAQECPPNCPFQYRGPRLIHSSSDPHPSPRPENGISVGSSVSAQRTVVSSRPRYSVPHLVLCIRRRVIISAWSTCRCQRDGGGPVRRQCIQTVHWTVSHAAMRRALCLYIVPYADCPSGQIASAPHDRRLANVDSIYAYCPTSLAHIDVKKPSRSHCLSRGTGQW